MLGGELAVLQAPMFDGLSFDPGALSEDGWTTAEVDIGGRQVAEAFVVSAVIVVVDERLDLGFQGTWVMRCSSSHSASSPDM